MRAVMVAAAVVVVAGLLIVGCGGDDDSGEETISKQEWIDRAGQICTEGDAEINAQADEFFGEQGEPAGGELSEFVTVVIIPGTEDQINQIDDLPAPEGDEEEIDEIVVTARAGIEEIKEDPELLGSEESSLAEATTMIQDYGVEECGGR